MPVGLRPTNSQEETEAQKDRHCERKLINLRGNNAAKHHQ